MPFARTLTSGLQENYPCQKIPRITPLATRQHFSLRTSQKRRRSMERSPLAGWSGSSTGNLSKPEPCASTAWWKTKPSTSFAARRMKKRCRNRLSTMTRSHEYTLCAISVVLDVQTRVSDLYSNPFDQVKEQLRLAIENVKERQEGELLNNADYGLLKNVPASQRISTRKG